MHPEKKGQRSPNTGGETKPDESLEVCIQSRFRTQSCKVFDPKGFHSSLLLDLHYPISKVPQPLQFTNKENQNPVGSVTY